MHSDEETVSYEPPAVVEIGSIADLTQGTGVPTTDNIAVSA
jgi:hypothetical protein